MLNTPVINSSPFDRESSAGSVEDSDQLIFADESPAVGPAKENAEVHASDALAGGGLPPVVKPAWKVMLIDDEPAVHQATKVALKYFSFEDRPLDFISAYSGGEAKTLIKSNPDTALMLLDVVMETQDAGLKVAQYVREDLENHAVRIVLRTGQPGQVPEESVVVNYDINDYKTKLELTQQKLFTTLVAGLRAYRDLRALQESKAALESFSQNLENIVTYRTQALEDEVHEREKAEEALKVYIHALTHDLRNPVTGMTNVLQTLIHQRQDEDKPKGEDKPPTAKIPLSVLKRMNAGCDRQLKMINTLIETHGIELWGVPLQPERFSLLDLIEDVVEDWQMRANKKRITIVKRIDSNVLEQIKGDRAQLWRVFENLIGNALKYNPPETVITVSASLAAASESTALSFPEGILQPVIHCQVSDTGVGISPTHQASIFELYSRGVSENPTQGLGLGLYICRRIIEAHGGSIGVSSLPGEGTEFWFELPLAKGFDNYLKAQEKHLTTGQSEEGSAKWHSSHPAG